MPHTPCTYRKTAELDGKEQRNNSELSTASCILIGYILCEVPEINARILCLSLFLSLLNVSTAEAIRKSVPTKNIFQTI